MEESIIRQWHGNVSSLDVGLLVTYWAGTTGHILIICLSQKKAFPVSFTLANADLDIKNFHRMLKLVKLLILFVCDHIGLSLQGHCTD